MLFGLVTQSSSSTKMASRFYHTSKVSLDHLQEFSTITAIEPPPDRLRPCNRNLRLPNQDLHQIGKRTLSIKSPVRTEPMERVDAYTLDKRNTYVTPKFLKVVPILPTMRDSKATLLILRMHASSTEQAIHAILSI